MTNVIPFVPRVVETTEDEMPPIKIDWTKVDPVFSVSHVEPGGFAKIDGLVPMEIALVLLEAVEAYREKRAATTKAKRTSKKKRAV